MTKTKSTTTKIPPVLMTATELEALTVRLRIMASIVADIEADGGEIDSDEDAQKYSTFARVCVEECTRIEDQIGRAMHDAEMCLKNFQNAYYLAQELRSAAPGAVGERLRQWEDPIGLVVPAGGGGEGDVILPTMTVQDGAAVHCTEYVMVPGHVEETAASVTYDLPPPEEEKTLTDLLPPAHLVEEPPDLTPYGITHVTLDMVPPAYRHPDGSLDARQASVDHFDLGLAVPGVTFAASRPAR